ncbi:hypothetical protein COU19_01180 [Candidatus Kaiserbacteria bacterium CG10_big_fil_rev_8_21_14_0_10_56_12]|uniref:Uncharacterized protein n=1 Tax=Candidatus Kaiserbacteria bacterium CG10_big_fil_rev_8_21_14_0_10_56_12 TaxID=1974611 RepID=A0A2H0UAB6_9BACT|nr:MAG: hypothetical protein COU19_01180 [Candidatus Kaiserbacteria bacterium CG10_big_fil_rev_8_21_14_0_10_56_12]
MSVLNDFLAKVVVQIINPLILLLTAGAFAVFVWGAFRLVLNAGDAAKREEGRSAIVWGIVGFVIIFGVYGILNFALHTFGLDSVQKISQ